MRFLAPAAALALLAACGSSSGGGATTFRPSAKGPGEACTATSQCQGSLVCQAGTCTALAAAPSCASPGTGAAALAAGAAFDPGDPGPTACVSTVRLPAFQGATDLVVQDLGEHHVNDLVSFAVTTGTTSFSLVSQEVDGSAPEAIVYQGSTYSNTVVPDQVKTPGGTLYYDDINLNQPDVVYYGISPVAGTFTAPNTTAGLDAVRSSGALPAGAWSFLANDWANECTKGVCTIAPPGGNTGRYHLWSVTKNGPIASTGALDVEAYLLLDPADGVGTTAADVAANPKVRRWVSSLAYYLAGAGVCLGSVTLHDLPTWVHQRYPSNSVDITGEGACDPLQQLFATSAAPARGANLFLVHELVDNTPGQGQNITVGIDGTIPGPSGFPGTIASGAAVGIFQEFDCTGSGTPSLTACGTDRIAYVAAHEIGHWLGLYHTTESDGGSSSFDPLGDTPQCPCSSCAPVLQRSQCGTASLQMDGAWCVAGTSCGGGDNLMFWLLEPGVSRGTLSRDQGQVVRLNPAVR